MYNFFNEKEIHIKKQIFFKLRKVISHKKIKYSMNSPKDQLLCYSKLHKPCKIIHLNDNYAGRYDLIQWLILNLSKYKKKKNYKEKIFSHNFTGKFKFK